MAQELAQGNTIAQLMTLHGEIMWERVEEVEAVDVEEVMVKEVRSCKRMRINMVERCVEMKKGWP